jgi:hypothetical protein
LVNRDIARAETARPPTSAQRTPTAFRSAAEVLSHPVKYRFGRDHQPAAAVDVGQHRALDFHARIQAEHLGPPPGQLDFRPDAGMTANVTHDRCPPADTKPTAL